MSLSCPRSRHPTWLVSPARPLSFVLALLVGNGCAPEPPAAIVVLTQPVSIIATRADETGEEDAYTLHIEPRGENWTLRTSLAPSPTPPSADGQAPRKTPASLQELTTWRSPYLFVRERNPGGRHSRAEVDHVFKIDGTNVTRVGTLSARFGPPGAQWNQEVFLDRYDRLEFTLLTARSNAPTFTLVLRERAGAFEADLSATWSHERDRYDQAVRVLQAMSREAPAKTSPTRRRTALAAALQALALSRYCEQSEAYDTALTLSRQVLGDTADLELEVAAVIPGELAPSSDPMLRSQPALLNLFKETATPPPGATRMIPAPSVTLPANAPTSP